MVEPRIIIIGAGPAGTRCAEALVAAGIRPTLIDEARRDGGQIYRRQPETFSRSYATLYGTEAKRAEAIHRSFEALRDKIDYRPDTLVWNIANGIVYAASGTRLVTQPFDALILCTGATDRLMPVKGWNLAGTFTLGGAQIALKSQACAIGEQIVFMGTGALLYLVAAQYLKAGANVAAVLDTSPASLRLRALPKLLAQPAAVWHGVALTQALKRGRVPVHTGIEPVEIEGSAEVGVSAISFKDGKGRLHRLACDAAGLGYHLRPEAQLADLARCEFHFDSLTRQWLPQTDLDGRSSVPGIYLAGDGARIRGARAAECAGRLAALAALRDLGRSVPVGAITESRKNLARLGRFAQGLAEAFPWPVGQAAKLPDDGIVCRCESISAGELRRVVNQAGACEANRAKAFSRVGMGRCQGRYCGHAAAEIIAHAAGVPVEQVGRLRGQAPVKPLPVAIGEDAA